MATGLHSSWWLLVRPKLNRFTRLYIHTLHDRPASTLGGSVSTAPAWTSHRARLSPPRPVGEVLQGWNAGVEIHDRRAAPPGAG